MNPATGPGILCSDASEKYTLGRVEDNQTTNEPSHQSPPNALPNEPVCKFIPPLFIAPTISSNPLKRKATGEVTVCKEKKRIKIDLEAEYQERQIIKLEQQIEIVISPPSNHKLKTLGTMLKERKGDCNYSRP